MAKPKDKHAKERGDIIVLDLPRVNKVTDFWDMLPTNIPRSFIGKIEKSIRQFKKEEKEDKKNGR